MDDNLLAYRVTQLEQRQKEHESAVSQIRDAIISVREDSREIRNRLTSIEGRRRRDDHEDEFRWTKLQVWSAIILGLLIFVLNVYLALKK